MEIKGRANEKAKSFGKPRLRRQRRNRICGLVLERFERLVTIVGVQGVKSSTMLNPYGGESVEVRGANPHKDRVLTFSARVPRWINK